MVSGFEDEGSLSQGFDECLIDLQRIIKIEIDLVSHFKLRGQKSLHFNDFADDQYSGMNLLKLFENMKRDMQDGINLAGYKLVISDDEKHDFFVLIIANESIGMSLNLQLISG